MNARSSTASLSCQIWRTHGINQYNNGGDCGHPQSGHLRIVLRSRRLRSQGAFERRGRRHFVFRCRLAPWMGPVPPQTPTPDLRLQLPVVQMRTVDGGIALLASAAGRRFPSAAMPNRFARQTFSFGFDGLPTVGFPHNPCGKRRNRIDTEFSAAFGPVFRL